MLALASPKARLLDVGKRCGNKRITQEEINARLVGFATGGNFVVRLKSGDPLVFGRGGEEIEALRRAQIEIEIVPGITAAVAAAASAQISLTDRRWAEHVLLISAHHAPGNAGPDWGGLISPRSMIVVYMPGQHENVAHELILAGLNCHTPCIAISKVSLPEEQSFKATLGTLCFAPPLPAPSLLIVGESVATSSLAESRPLLTDEETETETFGPQKLRPCS